VLRLFFKQTILDAEQAVHQGVESFGFKSGIPNASARADRSKILFPSLDENDVGSVTF